MMVDISAMAAMVRRGPDRQRFAACRRRLVKLSLLALEQIRP
jgi:hypothetical protein